MSVNRMAKRSLVDTLFDQVEIVKNGTPEDLERAAVVCTIAEKMIDLAKTQIRTAEVYDKLKTEAAREILASEGGFQLLPGDSSTGGDESDTASSSPGQSEPRTP